MSDVSKTSDLVTEARRWANGHPNRRVSELIHGLVDALETATRVPVQGEPNDDRTPEFEAIEQELFRHQPLLSMQDGSIRGCKCMDRVFVTKTEDWGTHLAEVFTRLSRTTVPDAATEELLKRVEEAEAQSAEDRVEWQQMKERASQRFNAYQQKKRELRQMEIRAEKAEAERDAALAAIERVRAAIRQYPNYGARFAVEAALDGAPEPEVKP